MLIQYSPKRSRQHTASVGNSCNSLFNYDRGAFKTKNIANEDKMSLKTIVKASANRHCLVVQTDLTTIGTTKAPQSKFSHDLHIMLSIHVLHATLL